jgi:hypothetical protein
MHGKAKGLLQGLGRTGEAAAAIPKAIAVYEAKGNVVSAADAPKELAELGAGAKAPPT